MRASAVAQPATKDLLTLFCSHIKITLNGPATVVQETQLAVNGITHQPIAEAACLLVPTIFAFRKNNIAPKPHSNHES